MFLTQNTCVFNEKHPCFEEKTPVFFHLFQLVVFECIAIALQFGLNKIHGRGGYISCFLSKFVRSLNEDRPMMGIGT